MHHDYWNFSFRPAETTVKIYPNPFILQTTVEISPSEKQENTVMKVFDGVGREIISSDFGKDNKIILGRDKLNSGIYIFRVYQKEKVITTGKILAE